MSITQDRASLGRFLSDLRTSKVVDIEGLDGLYDNLERIVGAVAAERLKPTFFEAGAALRDQAKNNAPYDPRRKEGYHLRESIFCAPGQKNEPNVLVGLSRSRKKRGKPSAPHGILVEYGTSKMAAQPFFRPAITQTSGRMRDIIITGVEKAISEAIK
jgi:HK97 gp10 family phage protein